MYDLYWRLYFAGFNTGKKLSICTVRGCEGKIRPRWLLGSINGGCFSDRDQF
jgi:hypothetical protein